LGNKEEIQKTAIVVFHNGAFGGASKRDTNLFLQMNRMYPGYFYLFVNKHLYRQLKEIYDVLPEDRIKIIETPSDLVEDKAHQNPDMPRYYPDNIADPMDIDKQHSTARKIYWYFKNKRRQYNIFKKIEELRAELGVKVFYGVSSGVLPLTFYLKEKPRRAALIFSDADSWFTDVHEDMKKLWYTKYYSFNYALENSDIIDFLSPYILEGVKAKGVKIKEGSAYVSKSSFIDYSKCSVSDKNKFEVAFCSRLEPDKNPMLYLEAAKEILKKYSDVKFHILGEGTLVREIKEFIDSNNLSSSINFQFHKNPPDIIKNTTVFVSIQNNTNYPSQSVLEAMACGNAIIASSRGDTGLFINNSNGILIELNKNELISAIEQFIIDPELAKKMGLNGRDMAMKTHTIENFSVYLLELIEEANNKILNYEI
jgi:glycosyltransferase involved in cell wall biosynthesis